MTARAKPMDVKAMLDIALLVTGTYALLKYVLPVLSTVTQGASGAVNAVSSGLARLYLAAAGPGAMKLAGTVILGNGVEIPLSSIQSTVRPTGGTDANGNPVVQFTYLNQRYQFTGPADETGTYYAVLV